jgi:hypothetical protein
MNPQLEKDLKDTMDIISSNWKMQNNSFDRSTNFIYRMNSLNDCMIEIERTRVDKDYALHRWYNYMTSIYCEYIFCDYGAVHEEDKFNHDVDIYIDGIPFDVKLTVYPAKLSSRPYDLKTRVGKDEMIRWYYANQSQQRRKQILNRLYVVCDANTSHENMVMKSNFDLMRHRISSYMNYIKKYGLNELVIEDAGNEYRLKSDIIHLD